MLYKSMESIVEWLHRVQHFIIMTPSIHDMYSLTQRHDFNEMIANLLNEIVEVFLLHSSSVGTTLMTASEFLLTFSPTYDVGLNVSSIDVHAVLVDPFVCIASN